MEFTYCFYLVDTAGFSKRIDTTTSLSEVTKLIEDRTAKKLPWRVECTDHIHNKTSVWSNEDDLMDHTTMLERRIWRDKPELEVANAMKWDPFNEVGILTKPKNVTADESEPKKASIEFDKISNAVDASHYKNYCEGLQWIDAMSRIPQFRDPNVFKGAVLLQIQKYLSRLGRKDADLQELQKAAFYLGYLIAFIRNNNKPIKIEDTPGLFQ